VPLTVGIATLLLVTGLAVWTMTRPTLGPPAALIRFPIILPPGVQVVPFLSKPRVTPDGTAVAFTGTDGTQRQVYVQTLDQLEARPVPGTEGGSQRAFSPDGRTVLFVVRGLPSLLKKVSLDGGPVVTITDKTYALGVSLGREDALVVGSREGLWLVPPPGPSESSVSRVGSIELASGEPRLITTLLAGEQAHSFPEFLPDGRAVLFTRRRSGGTGSQVAVYSLESGESWPLVRGTAAQFAASGHLVFARGTTLWAVRFDSKRLEVRGDPVPVVEGVQANAQGASSFALARDGTLVYRPARPRAERHLVWVYRDGREEPMAAKPGPYNSPRISPDGRYAAVQVGDRNRSQVHIFDLATNEATPLTYDGSNESPVWSPDSQRVAFSSNREGEYDIFWTAADGTEQPVPLTASENAQFPESWSRDGQTLVFGEITRETGADVYALSIADGASEPLVQHPGADFYPTVSPDGRWIAYGSQVGGGMRIWVEPFPDVGDAPRLITPDRGDSPVWAPDGRELLFMQGPQMMVVSIDTEPTFGHGTPTALFDTSGYVGVSRDHTRPWDVHPDGNRFLMIKQTPPATGATTEPDYIVVKNWFEELQRLVSTN